MDHLPTELLTVLLKHSAYDSYPTFHALSLVNRRLNATSLSLRTSPDFSVFFLETKEGLERALYATSKLPDAESTEANYDRMDDEIKSLWNGKGIFATGWDNIVGLLRTRKRMLKLEKILLQCIKSAHEDETVKLWYKTSLSPNLTYTYFREQLYRVVLMDKRCHIRYPNLFFPDKIVTGFNEIFEQERIRNRICHWIGISDEDESAWPSRIEKYSEMQRIGFTDAFQVIDDVFPNLLECVLLGSDAWRSWAKTHEKWGAELGEGVCSIGDNRADFYGETYVVKTIPNIWWYSSLLEIEGEVEREEYIDWTLDHGPGLGLRRRFLGFDEEVWDAPEATTQDRMETLKRATGRDLSSLSKDRLEEVLGEYQRWSREKLALDEE